MGDVGAVLGVSPSSTTFSGGVTSVASESHISRLETQCLALYYLLDSLASARFVDELGSNELRNLLTLLTLHGEGLLGGEILSWSKHMTWRTMNSKSGVTSGLL